MFFANPDQDWEWYVNMAVAKVRTKGKKGRPEYNPYQKGLSWNSSNKGKCPVSVPGPSKGFVEDMGVPKLQSRFVRPESGVMRVESDFHTVEEEIIFGDVSGENWHSTWGEVLQVINPPGGKSPNPVIRDLGGNIGADHYRSIPAPVIVLRGDTAVFVKESTLK